MQNYDFGWALKALKSGKLVTRSSWENRVYLGLLTHNSAGEFCPRIICHDASKEFVYGRGSKQSCSFWPATHASLLETDWKLYKS